MFERKRLFTAAGLAALALVGGASRASAGTVVVSSIVDQSGFFADQAGNGAAYPLTDALQPYDFGGQVNNFANVTSIDSLTVTLTSIFDGDSGPGDFAENHLFLGLDGVNTGLALNGLTNNDIVTLTASLLNPGVQAALIAALQDGKLVGSIIDTSANPPVGDQIGISSLVQTSLDLSLSGANLAGPGGPGGGGGGNQVPLPAAALLAPLGAATAGAYRRRFRKAK